MWGTRNFAGGEGIFFYWWGGGMSTFSARGGGPAPTPPPPSVGKALGDVKADVKQQQIKVLVAYLVTFYKKYLQNIKYNEKQA